MQYAPLLKYYMDFYLPDYPYAFLSDAQLTSSTFSDETLSLSLSASSGKTSTTEVYCGKKGEPISVSGALSWSYDSETKILTIAVLHTGSEEITVYFEHVPPTTTINLSGVVGNNNWFISEVKVSLSAIDDISGVDKTEYSFDNDTWTAYTAPFIINKEGYTVIYYNSTDKAGNVEAIKIKMLKIDRTAPTGSIVINNDEAFTTSTLVKLTLTATDVTSGVSQIRFSNNKVWDTEPWEEWQTTEVPLSWYLPSGDGEKTVYFQIKDKAGLVSDTYSDTIKLDTAPPTGSVTINNGAAYTNTATVSLTLLATDATSDVVHMHFSHDNITWTPWEDCAVSRAWVLPTGDGTKTVYTQFMDNAGLISLTSQDTIILDTTKPTADAGIAQTVAEDIQVTFNGSASWDENDIASYTWTFTDVTTKTLTGEKPAYTFTTPGVYTVTLNVTDAAGNWATDLVVITVVDITDPVANAGQDQTVNVGTTVIFDASGSTDNVGIVSYEWDFGDGTTATGITATHTYANLGSYTVTLTVKDAAGNTDTHSTTVTVFSSSTKIFPIWIVGATIATIAIAVTATLLLKKRK